MRAALSSRRAPACILQLQLQGLLATARPAHLQAASSINWNRLYVALCCYALCKWWGNCRLLSCARVESRRYCLLCCNPHAFLCKRGHHVGLDRLVNAQASSLG